MTNTTFETQGYGINLARVLLLKLQTKAPHNLAISSELDRSTVDRCQRVGGLGYVVLPYDPPDMLARVEKALRSRDDVGDHIIHHNIREVLHEFSRSLPGSAGGRPTQEKFDH